MESVLSSIESPTEQRVILSSNERGSVDSSTISRSEVLKILVDDSHPVSQLKIPVSEVGLQTWISWVKHPWKGSNCGLFDAIIQGLQVAHFLDDRDTVRSIVTQLVEIIRDIGDWEGVTGTNLPMALQTLPADLCHLIFDSSNFDISHVFSCLPGTLHEFSLHQFSTVVPGGIHLDLEHQLSRSSTPALSRLTLQNCVHLNLKGISVGGSKQLPLAVSLPAVTYLSLSNARFLSADTIPFLSSLLSPNLRHLDLSYLHCGSAQLYNQISQSILSLTNLTYLDLTHHLTQLQGVPLSLLIQSVLKNALQLPKLLFLKGAASSSLGSIRDVLAHAWKLSTLSIHMSDCQKLVASGLLARNSSIKQLKVNLPPLTQCGRLFKAPIDKDDQAALADVMLTCKSALETLEFQSIRTVDDICGVPTAQLCHLTNLTNLNIKYTPVASLDFLQHMEKLRELRLIGTVTLIADPAEFSTYLSCLSLLTLLEFDVGQEFDRQFVDPAVWDLGMDPAMLRSQLADNLCHLPQLSHLVFFTRNMDEQADVDAEFVSALKSLTNLTSLRLDSSFSAASPGFADWISESTSLKCLEFMDASHPAACLEIHQALGSLVHLTRLEITWLGCPGAMEQTIAAFGSSLSQLSALQVLHLHGSVLEASLDERKSSVVDLVLGAALPRLTALTELSLQALQVASAFGACAISRIEALERLSVCDLVFVDAEAACRFGRAILSLRRLRQLCTSWVELLNPLPFGPHTVGEAGDVRRSRRNRFLNITGWLLMPGNAWYPCKRQMQGLRILRVEDFHDLQWSVLGVCASNLPQLQLLEIDGLSQDREPADADVLMRHLVGLVNLEEVRFITCFESVSRKFRRQLLKEILPGTHVSFIGHRTCGPHCKSLC